MLWLLAHAPSTVIAASALLVRLGPDPGINPNSDGLPGLGELRRLVGAGVTWGLVLCVAGMVISAAVWALSSFSGNYHHASKGKVGLLVASGAAILIGGASTIIKFFGDIGSRISG